MPNFLSNSYNTFFSKYLILSFILLTFSAKSQYQHIKFKGDFEEAILSNVETSSNIELLLAISESGSKELLEEYQHRINLLIENLDNKRIGSRSQEKQLKLIFKTTHKYFFSKYEEVANFNKIFSSGTYNCVSASALYSLILEHYGIPFKIKETPTHVFVLAYPGTKNILLESTAPKNGYFSPGENSIQKGVKALVELKYYTQSEVDSIGVENVYMNFHYNEDDISIKQLAGLQYQNEAITYYNDENYKDAVNSIRKSALLYPSNRNELLEYSALAQILNDSDYENYQDITYLSDFANIPITEDVAITSTYQNLLQKKLFYNSDVEMMDSIFSILNSKLNDSTQLNTIKELHYKAYASFYGQKNNFSQALKYAKKAYQINPLNVGVQSMINSSVIRDISTRGATISTENEMCSYEKEFPFLSEDNIFQSLYVMVLANISYNHFRADDFKNGLKYLKKMADKRLQHGADLQFDENLFGMVYAEAGAAYYRESKYWEAKKIIDKGLSFVPNHPELKIRLSIVEEELD